MDTPYFGATVTGRWDPPSISWYCRTFVFQLTRPRKSVIRTGLKRGWNSEQRDLSLLDYTNCRHRSLDGRCLTHKQYSTTAAWRNLSNTLERALFFILVINRTASQIIFLFVICNMTVRYIVSGFPSINWATSNRA